MEMTDVDLAVCNMTFENLTIVVEEVLCRLNMYSDMYMQSVEDDTCFDNSEWLYLNDVIHTLYKRYFYLKDKMQEKKVINGFRPVENDRRKTATDNYFVTVNPPEMENPVPFFEAVHRFCGLKVVKNSEYVFEQRGITEGDYRGIHTHMLICKNGKPSAFKRELHRIFDKFFPTIPSEKLLNVENVENVEIPKIKRYMNGEKRRKSGKKKSEKVVNDKCFRYHYKLDAKYTYNAPE